jgi:hypothetical protein
MILMMQDYDTLREGYAKIEKSESNQKQAMKLERKASYEVGTKSKL